MGRVRIRRVRLGRSAFRAVQTTGRSRGDEETEIEFTYSLNGKKGVELTLRWSPFKDDPGWVRAAISGGRDIERRADAALDALNRRAVDYPDDYANDPLEQVRALLRAH